MVKEMLVIVTEDDPQGARTMSMPTDLS